MNQLVSFVKVQGGGNDFVAFDNRKQQILVDVMPQWAKVLCDRRFGIGADGLFFLNTSKTCSVRWDFYNSDGSRAPMCGNGARCAGLLSLIWGFTDGKQPFTLETDRGAVTLSFPSTLTGSTSATENEHKRIVRAKLPPVSRLSLKVAKTISGRAVHFVDTSVPHAVVILDSGSLDELKSLQLRKEALEVRDALPEQMKSTNVNFAVLDHHSSSNNSNSKLSVRTFERGVEDETLACGTGSAAVAVIARALGIVDVNDSALAKNSPLIEIAVQGGVSINVNCTPNFVEIEGPAAISFFGTISTVNLSLPLN